MTKRRTARLMWPAIAAAVLVAAVLGVLADTHRHTSPPSAAFTPVLDPGTTLRGAAPDFTLTDQFGAPVSLRSFRGKVVILAFNDAQCTTICPLTTTAMVDAKRLLGSAGSRVALLGIDANPQAISVADVRSYSELHGMARAWQFLTGSLAQLKHVWRAYHIDVAVEQGQIDHTPALFVIDARGNLAKLYLTQMSYSSIQQQAQLLAREASSLLPDHPRVLSSLSYAPVPTISPTQHVSLPLAGGGTVRLGPGTPRLLLFFATWDREVTNLASQLEALNRYQAIAAAEGLPKLLAVDEGSVEPSPAALGQFLSGLPRPLSYPVAVDSSGRLADGYGVQDEPWFTAVSGAGKWLWYYDVSTIGWLGTESLVAHVRAALAHAKVPTTPAQVQQALAGSPAPLDALHKQASQLLGSKPALFARLKALRGYPVVLNVWGSWCGPCRAEFGLLAAASGRYGRQVAFLGADTSDSAADARTFLSQHPVSYPSYQISSPSDLSSLAVVVGLPTTIYISAAGKVVNVHPGEYDSQGTLDADVTQYAQLH